MGVDFRDYEGDGGIGAEGGTVVDDDAVVLESVRGEVFGDVGVCAEDSEVECFEIVGRDGVVGVLGIEEVNIVRREVKLGEEINNFLTYRTVGANDT